MIRQLRESEPASHGHRGAKGGRGDLQKSFVAIRHHPKRPSETSTLPRAALTVRKQSDPIYPGYPELACAALPVCLRPTTLSFCLHVAAPHSFSLSRARALVQPLVCTHARTLKPGSQVAQVVTRRLGSSVVPGHLVPLHCNHIHLVCLVFLSCFFGSPIGRRVCVTQGFS